jgi:hypothetical protein
VRRVVRERVLREREAVLRLAMLRGFAEAVERFAADFLAAGLLREAAAPLDFARVVRAFVPLDFARVARAFVPLDFARAVDLRFAGLRVAVRAVRTTAAAAAGTSSVAHLPDITRCAASATASAMIDPSFVALDITLLAACDAVSAASSPASRILRRAAGLALIAAAAAASPAASISLLIAAFANLSTVLLPDFAERPDADDVEDDLGDAFLGDAFLGDAFLEDVPGDFAIAFLSVCRLRKTL